MEVLRAVVHNVIKEQHHSNATIRWKKEVFGIDQKLRDFVEELEKVYQKHRGKGYGIFKNDDDEYPFQRYLNAYLEKKENRSFYQFSIDATKLFEKRLTEAQASTGGYLFFLHYITDLGKEYLAAIILNDKIGYAIQQDTLELLDVINLNMEHLSMGARINLQEYLANREETYLSFIRGTKKVRNYFTLFIGCEDYQTSKTSTERTINVLYEYCQDNHFRRETMRRLEASLFNYLKANKEIDLYALSQYLINTDADRFYLRLQEAEISDRFEPDPEAIKGLMRFHYERNGLRIEFPKEKLDSQEIRYDDERGELIIQDADGELGRRIRNELGYSPGD